MGAWIVDLNGRPMTDSIQSQTWRNLRACTVRSRRTLDQALCAVLAGARFGAAQMLKVLRGVYEDSVLWESGRV